MLFYLGGSIYMGIEVLYRGWSHGSMFLAGGLSFLLIGWLGHCRPLLPLPLRLLTGALIITMVELGMGLLVNRSYTVWDYRDQPLNFHGQICLGFSLLWIPVSLGAMFLYDQAERKLRQI